MGTQFAAGQHVVYLNVYDVVPVAGNTAEQPTLATVITKVNRITRDWGLGGIFHGAVQLEDYEWSFGYCERGTGVYCVKAKENPMYQYRETLELGPTLKSKQEIKAILQRLKTDWPGLSYDLLSRNCCHFCEVLCQELEVKPVPAWLNRFATGADATVAFTQDAVAMARNVTETLKHSASQSLSWLKDNVGRMMTRPTTSSTPGHDSHSGPLSPSQHAGFRLLHRQHGSTNSMDQPTSHIGHKYGLPGGFQHRASDLRPRNGHATAEPAGASSSSHPAQSARSEGRIAGMHLNIRRPTDGNASLDMQRVHGEGDNVRDSYGGRSNGSGLATSASSHELGSLHGAQGYADMMHASADAGRGDAAAMDPFLPHFARAAVPRPRSSNGVFVRQSGGPLLPDLSSDPSEQLDEDAVPRFHRQACLDFSLYATMTSQSDTDSQHQFAGRFGSLTGQGSATASRPQSGTAQQPAVAAGLVEHNAISDELPNTHHGSQSVPAELLSRVSLSDSPGPDPFTTALDTRHVRQHQPLTRTDSPLDLI